MSFHFPPKITLCEVGPRDGLQNEVVIPTPAQKADLIDRMTDAGFPVIEVGSFMSPKAVPQMAGTDEKPVGLVYVAVVSDRFEDVRELHLARGRADDRENIRFRSSSHAFDLALRALRQL